MNYNELMSERIANPVFTGHWEGGVAVVMYAYLKILKSYASWLLIHKSARRRDGISAAVETRSDLPGPSCSR